MNDELDLGEVRQTAERAACQAGALLREKWDEPRTRTRKGFRDFVTDADFAAQSLITSLIRLHYPSHGFLAEEEDSSLPENRPVTWIIDPVDGTSNFSRQIDNFSISIAVAGGDDILVGVIYDPMRDELFSAARGRGCMCNRQPMQVSDTARMSEAILSMDWSRLPAQRQALITSLGDLGHRVHTMRAIGSAALALAWVATGRLDAYVNMGAAPWDIAAGALLIAEAGGALTTPQGETWHVGTTTPGCVASNGRWHDQLLQSLTLPTPS